MDFSFRQQRRQLRRYALLLVVGWLWVGPLATHAQVCPDPSGPLLLNQTFGNDASPVAVANQTTYDYVPGSCPGDGQFTLVSSMDGSCFLYTWYPVLTDHTPNSNRGNMLVINGGPNAGTFFTQPVSGLCRGTTYEVSFWALNLLRAETCLNSLVPDLAISVETKSGLVLQTTALGQLTQTEAPLWKRFATVFTVPQNVDDVVVKLVNNLGGSGCGNDLAVDDLQVRQCSECLSEPNPVYVPGAFTPNNDGMNDKLDVIFRTSATTSFALRIYDRWGSLVYVSNDPTQQWDGTYRGESCTAGAYTWMIAYRPNSQAKTDYVQTGSVLLLR